MLQLNVQLLLNGQPVDFVDSIRYFGLKAHLNKDGPDNIKCS